MQSIWKGRICPRFVSSINSASWKRDTLPRICTQQIRSIGESRPRKTAALAEIPTIEVTFDVQGIGNSYGYYQHHFNPTRSNDQSFNARELDFSLVGLEGGEIVHEILFRHDVKHIFGYPSQWTQTPREPFESLFKSTHMRTIVPRHEQGAGHMAEGYARVRGKPGVVLVTSGSSITNLVTPMQDALCDGTPMVILCSRAPAVGFGNDEYQESDILGISASCTKWNIRVNSTAELPQRINEAFEVAVSGRPGPVLVDIPRHVISGILNHAISTKTLHPKSNNSTNLIASGPDHALSRALDRVAHLVDMAQQPVLYVGQGMLARPEGSAILKEFADKACIPVATSLQGLGAFNELDWKSLHMLGLHGTGYANHAIQEADLIIALGARFDDRITGYIPKFAPKALRAAAEGRGGIVHFEIAPKNVNKVVQATEAILGDCATNLSYLIPRIQRVEERPEWFTRIDFWKKRFPLSAYKRYHGSGKINAQEVIEKLSDLTAHMKEKTIITTGVGQHQMWAAQYFRWTRPRTMITSGGLGTMGYGVPAAIGAKIARPDCLVVDIDGDASFNMTMSELVTAAQYNIGIKVLLFNNEEMGMVSDLQRLYYQERFVHNRQKNPDFVVVSEAFGVVADRCVDPTDIEDKLKWLLENDGPAVLEIVTKGNCPVWPIVPSGKGLDEFITYPEV